MDVDTGRARAEENVSLDEDGDISAGVEVSNDDDKSTNGEFYDQSALPSTFVVVCSRIAIASSRQSP